MHFNVILLGCFLIFGAVYADEVPPFSHDALDRVLQKFVDAEGRVDYAALKRHSEVLDAYVAQLATVGPGTHPGLFSARQDSMAYWINAYNALVLKGVVNAYPVKSVRDIALFYGFFKRHRFDVDGRRLTLDHIEHDILRPVFGDPRIHAAINCAAVSCPRLRQEAFLPESLDAQLDAAIREMIASPQHVRLDRERGVLYLSKIFDWFSSDFTDWYADSYQVEKATLSDYVGIYMSEVDRQYLRRDIKVAFFDYDWSLNDAKGER